jgi:hypothetical protein
MHVTLRGTVGMACATLCALIMAGCGSHFISSPRGAEDSAATPSASVTSSADPGLKAGAVTLTPNRHVYGTDDSIVVTIHNGLSQAILVADQRGGGCPAVSIERMANGSWVHTGNCAPARASQLTLIAAGASLEQSVSFAMGGADTGAGWPVGAYRATLSYQLGATVTAGQPGGVAYSAEFTVT